MTPKQKALKLALERGCTVTINYHNSGLIESFEVFPPLGKGFDDELSSLICHGWEDVTSRLRHVEITKEKQSV